MTTVDFKNLVPEGIISPDKELKNLCTNFDKDLFTHADHTKLVDAVSEKSWKDAASQIHKSVVTNEKAI